MKVSTFYPSTLALVLAAAPFMLLNRFGDAYAQSHSFRRLSHDDNDSGLTSSQVLCRSDVSDTDCGIVEWDKSCDDVLRDYAFLEGNCCTLHEEDNHSKCRLVVDGSNSFCSYKARDESHFEHIYMTEENSGTCPTDSTHPVVYEEVTTTPTPTPPPSSKYDACLERKVSNCANTQCTVHDEDFLLTVSECVDADPEFAGSCVGQAATKCHSREGRPSSGICENLLAIAESGQLTFKTCRRLRNGCGWKDNAEMCSMY